MQSQPAFDFDMFCGLEATKEIQHPDVTWEACFDLELKKPTVQDVFLRQSGKSEHGVVHRWF